MENTDEVWTDELDIWLVNVINEHKKSIAYAAKRMKRTVQSVENRLAQLNKRISNEHTPTPTPIIIEGLTTEQHRAIEAVKRGQNVLITGPAGTGKSFTIKTIIEWAESANKAVALTATTGLAASLIGGNTINSYLSIGTGTKSVDELVAFARKTKFPIKNVNDIDILVIDEVSMMSDALFDKVYEYINTLRMKKNTTLPWGGLQVILVGDFCQLPPVQGNFCFKAAMWPNADLHIVQLTTLIRQSGDATFQKLLMDLRFGKCTMATYDILKALSVTTYQNGIIPTRLYSMNVDVDKINMDEYEKLKLAGAQTHVYKAKFKTEAVKWMASCRIPSEIALCEGAQVFVTHNIPSSGLVNGSIGIVRLIGVSGVNIGLCDGTSVTINYHTLVCEGNRNIKAEFMPLKLAFALTIHKSQGMTLDAVEMDLGKSIFEYGQAYTALSRAKSLNCVKIIDIVPKSFRIHPDVKAFYEGDGNN